MLLEPKDIEEILKPDGGKFKVDSVESAFIFCKKIALKHYENFPVGSVIIPKSLRKHFFSVYAYSRLADDIADEYLHEFGKSKAIAGLELFEKYLLDDNYAIAQAGNPVFIALAATRKEKNLPAEPFQKLLKAFLQDINFVQAETISDSLSYCQNSANPVGEIVLRLFDLYNSKTAPLSDNICTALQLANFWQDISVDRTNGREFIPKSYLSKYGLRIDNLFSSENSIKLYKCLSELYDYTYELFDNGAELVDYIDNFRLKLEIVLTINGGLKILQKTKRLNVNILEKRPKLNIIDIINIMIKSIFFKVRTQWR